MPEALYGIAGEAVELATENSEADPAAVLFTVLAFAAAHFGAAPHFAVGETKHPPRLFVSIVGQSSRARKGTSAHPVERIFKEAEEFAGLPPLVVTPGPFSSGEGITNAVRDDLEIIVKGLPKIDPGVEDKRLLAMLGEFGGTLAAISRDGSTLSSVLRTAWESGNMAPLTKFSRIKCTGAHINFVGHITKRELDELLCSSDIHNGLANRILWVCARRKKLVAMPVPMPAEQVRKIAASIGAALKRAQGLRRVDFDESAKRLWEKCYEDITLDKPGIFGIVTARAEAQIIRLALVYALLDIDDSIRTKHLTAAMAAWEYCDKSAQYLFGRVQPDPRANRILNALESGMMSKTDLHNLFGKNLPAIELNRTLAEMESTGKITSHSAGKNARVYRLSGNMQ